MVLSRRDVQERLPCEPRSLDQFVVGEACSRAVVVEDEAQLREVRFLMGHPSSRSVARHRAQHSILYFRYSILY